MFGERRKFYEVEAYDGGMVKLRNKSPCIMIGKGIVAFNESTTCEDAYLVEGLKYNLLRMV